MGVIAHKGVLYGGGSDVEANPQDTATDNLEKVSIDGTVYDVKDADAIHTSDIGTANGVAELDANGLVPSSQLPSYVDDVLEYASVSAFPATGETGKIYVALDTNLTYRWSGSAYVEISPSLALGETSSTAYRGDRGKTAYDHATESGRSGAKSAGLYKIGVTAQGHVASTSAVAKADLTALGVADQNDVDAIEADIEGFKTVTGEYITINDAAALPANEYALTLSPVQNLNGYDSPWVGGANVNKLNIDSYTCNAPIPSYGATITKDGDLVTITFVDYPATAATIGFNILTATEAWFDKTGYAFKLFDIQDPAGKLFNNNVRWTSAANNNNIATDFKNMVQGESFSVSFRIMLYLTASGTPTTYSPYSNICPIHGADEVGVRVCGKNLLEVTASTTTINGVTFTVNADGTVKVTGTATGTAVFQLLGGYNPDSYTELTNFGLNYNTNYSLNGCPSGGSNSTYRFILRSGGSAGNKVDTGNGVDFNIASDDTTLKWMPCIVISSGYAVPSGGLLFKPMIRYTTVTDSTFEPYTLHSTTITLPSTVYGGSVEMGGTGTETIGYVEFDGSNDEAWDIYQADGINQLYIPTADLKGYTLNLYANEFKTISINDRTGNYGTIYASSTAICVNIANIASVADFRTWLSNNNLQVAYELATPTDITVTPFPQTLLEGVNNLWAEMVENSTVIDNAQQSLSYQPQNIVGQLRQEIEAKPDSFAQLSDISFSNLSNGQIPKWNSTSQKWENANESGGGGLPAWTKIWNYKSGATFTMPTGKADIMLVIVLDASNTRMISNVYPVEYPFSKILNTEYFDGTDAVWMEITTSNVVNVGNNTQQPTSYFDFEIWVR